MSARRDDALRFYGVPSETAHADYTIKCGALLWCNKARRHAAFYNLNDKRPCTMDNHAGALAGKPFAPQRIEINKTVRPRA